MQPTPSQSSNKLIYTLIYPSVATLSSDRSSVDLDLDPDYDNIPLTPSPDSSPIHSYSTPVCPDGEHHPPCLPASHPSYPSSQAQLDYTKFNLTGDHSMSNEDSLPRDTEGYHSTLHQEYSLSPSILKPQYPSHSYAPMNYELPLTAVDHPTSIKAPVVPPFHGLSILHPTTTNSMQTALHPPPHSVKTAISSQMNTTTHLSDRQDRDMVSSRHPKFSFLTPSPRNRLQSSVAQSPSLLSHHHHHLKDITHAITPPRSSPLSQPRLEPCQHAPPPEPSLESLHQLIPITAPKQQQPHQQQLLPHQSPPPLQHTRPPSLTSKPQHPLLPGTISPNIGALDHLHGATRSSTPSSIVHPFSAVFPMGHTTAVTTHRPLPHQSSLLPSSPSPPPPLFLDQPIQHSFHHDLIPPVPPTCNPTRHGIASITTPTHNTNSTTTETTDPTKIGPSHRHVPEQHHYSHTYSLPHPELLLLQSQTPSHPLRSPSLPKIPTTTETVETASGIVTETGALGEHGNATGSSCSPCLSSTAITTPSHDQDANAVEHSIHFVPEPPSHAQCPGPRKKDQCQSHHPHPPMRTLPVSQSVYTLASIATDPPYPGATMHNAASNTESTPAQPSDTPTSSLFSQQRPDTTHPYVAAKHYQSQVANQYKQFIEEYHLLPILYNDSEAVSSHPSPELPLTESIADRAATPTAASTATALQLHPPTVRCHPCDTSHPYSGGIPAMNHVSNQSSEYDIDNLSIPIPTVHRPAPHALPNTNTQSFPTATTAAAASRFPLYPRVQQPLPVSQILPFRSSTDVDLEPSIGGHLLDESSKALMSSSSSVETTTTATTTTTTTTTTIHPILEDQVILGDHNPQIVSPVPPPPSPPSHHAPPPPGSQEDKTLCGSLSTPPHATPSDSQRSPSTITDPPASMPTSSALDSLHPSSRANTDTNTNASIRHLQMLSPLISSGILPTSYPSSHYLVIGMVGLPAHGKSFFARKLCRYLRWLRYNAALFSSSSYYEHAYRWLTFQAHRTSSPSSTFVPSMVSGDPEPHSGLATHVHDDKTNHHYHLLARHLGTLQCFYDMSQFMASGGRIILFDATNINLTRRDLLRHFLNSLPVPYTLLWVETIITQKQMVINNILNIHVDKTIFPDTSTAPSTLATREDSRPSCVGLGETTTHDDHAASTCDCHSTTSQCPKGRKTDPPSVAPINSSNNSSTSDNSSASPHRSLLSKQIDAFYHGIQDYAKFYTSLTDEELLAAREMAKPESNECYLKLYDNGQHSKGARINGWLLTKIAFYLLNLQTSSKYPLYFSRHGQSKANINNQVGTDLDLSPAGVLYAQHLARWIRQQLDLKEQRTFIPGQDTKSSTTSPQSALLTFPTQHPHTSPGSDTAGYDLTIYCSTLQRAISTAEHVYNHLVFPERYASSSHTPNHRLKRYRVNVIKWRALAEIDAGEFDGLTYEEIKYRDPVGYRHRSDDKLNYKYPRGESYKDVIDRIETVVYEIERVHNSPVLVIAHQAVIRCMIGYFINVARITDVPHLSVPLNTVIRVYTHTYPTEYHSINLIENKRTQNSDATPREDT